MVYVLARCGIRDISIQESNPAINCESKREENTKKKRNNGNISKCTGAMLNVVEVSLTKKKSGNISKCEGGT